MNYKCDKCDKHFTKKCNYLTHIKRKFPCVKPTNITQILAPDFTNICNFTPDFAPEISKLCMKSLENSVPTIPNLKLDNYDETNNNDPSFQKTNKKVHQCEHCLKIFSRNNVLQNHIKNSCKEKNKEIKTPKIQCNYCLETFVKKYGLKRHLNICKEKINQDNTQKKFDVIIKEMEILKKQNEELKSKIENIGNIGNIGNQNTSIVNNNNTINNTIVDNTNNNNITINLVAFGKENIESVLSNNECARILRRGINSIPELIKWVHFNKDIPQYNNCYISNLRDNNAHIYNGEQWLLIPRDTLISDLIENKDEYLVNKYNEYGTKLDKTTRAQFKKYIDQKETPTLAAQHKNDIKRILHNENHIPIETKKQIEQQSKCLFPMKDVPIVVAS
jgi:hypothetical protein